MSGGTRRRRSKRYGQHLQHPLDETFVGEPEGAPAMAAGRVKQLGLVAKPAAPVARGAVGWAALVATHFAPKWTWAAPQMPVALVGLRAGGF